MSVWQNFLRGLSMMWTAPRFPPPPRSIGFRLWQFQNDYETAEKAKSMAEAIGESWHLEWEGRATKLFLHPADDVMLPYVVMINRDGPMNGPLKFCGMTVALDHALKAGAWRIEL
jgi:hypothetical protein